MWVTEEREKPRSGQPGKQLTEIRRGGFLGQEAPRLPQLGGWVEEARAEPLSDLLGVQIPVQVVCHHTPKGYRASDADTVTLHHRAGRRMDF